MLTCIAGATRRRGMRNRCARSPALQHRRPLAACHISRPIPVPKRSIVRAHDAYVRAVIRWLAFVNQSVIRQHAAHHAATQTRVDHNRK
ncbi:hypothetical protein [Burkholderia cepacia]|uniref:hypothetical protein n=1 Tax=Burkholderia cepacia TaxID=292 RepID=UPI001590ED45|nr:hypothetical protein [Burkholderia cepacia]MBX3910812.1 hypothetical protein [Burkholderia cepacia]MBX3972711.1 hypothetical protein [Burkholderia cepacia]MBX3991820.1 hypothetical protein [Burkholderia cepacia]MBX4057565.1 hypothetical protein [Burkholderia cepacia]MBX4124784.1 hypothetical protein [Burkholderia cepacia]